MSSSESQLFVPSVLDRLMGAELPTPSELERNYAGLVRKQMAWLRRDLEILLNTRTRCGYWPRELNELEKSVVAYGLPDFTGARAGSIASQEQLVEYIRSAIERFEPRLRSIVVEPLDETEPYRRVFKFRISAVMLLGDESEAITLVSTLEPSTGSFHVQRD